MYRIPIYRVQLVRNGGQTAERKKVSQPAVAAEVLWRFLEGADREHFLVVLLDTQNEIIGIHTVTVGTLDACRQHERWELHGGQHRIATCPWAGLPLPRGQAVQD